VAPAHFRSTHGIPSSGGLACRPVGDVGVQRRGDLGFSRGRPPVPSPLASPSPPLLSSCGGQREIPKGAAADSGGGLVGAVSYRAAPRVSRHGSGRLGSLDVRAPSHATTSGGRGRARRGARRSLSRRPCVTVGNDRGRGKRWGKEELTDGPHMAVKQGGGWW
jgi:hypothetical protein